MKIKLSKKQWELIGKKTGWNKSAYSFGRTESLELGSTPSGEDCVQVGSDSYFDLYIAEAKAYIDQLKRQFPNIPDGVSFGIKSFPHDFGTYHEVVVKYNEDNEEAINFAFDVENNTPEYWDATAKEELNKIGYFEMIKVK